MSKFEWLIIIAVLLFMLLVPMTRTMWFLFGITLLLVSTIWLAIIGLKKLLGEEI